MSNIVPNSQIRFLTGVPIDKNYENSIDFLTVLEQYTYFNSLTPVHTMIGATRVRDGVIAVNTLADNLLSANYMMFQNTNFGNKWFYAFITNIEYVNNSMCHVYYQIDDIQTWMFDVTLRQCYVEREHTTTDRMFEHLIDEGFETSEYVNNDTAPNELTFNVYDAVLFTSYDPRQASNTPFVAPAQGNLNGLLAMDFQVQDSNGAWLPINDTDPANFDTMNPLEQLNVIVKQLIDLNQADSIVALMLIPRGLIEYNATSYPKNISLSYNNYTGNEALNGYTPKNKKLYNSPYCVMEIGCSDGQKEILQPEFLQTGNNVINIFPNISPSPNMIITPAVYRGDAKAWDKSISFDAFPQCCVNVNGYLAWVASGGLLVSEQHMLQSVVGGLASLSTGNIVGAMSTTLEGIINAQTKVDLAKRLPNTVKGAINTQALSSNQIIKVYQRRKCVKKDIAESMDNFFTMYGYKVNKVKQPSRRNRPHYTYLKTKGLHIDGGAPADAIERIEAIYNNGIRFWVTPSEVGNYSVNNAPT